MKGARDERGAAIGRGGGAGAGRVARETAGGVARRGGAGPGGARGLHLSAQRIGVARSGRGLRGAFGAYGAEAGGSAGTEPFITRREPMGRGGQRFTRRLFGISSKSESDRLC
ncbi:glycine-rich RNA-binding protein 10-like [Gallus gallus]|uniref:glycine-rich RNA-binding protein 10-like n=1 Tax=Gallus gallus TaxID=9031 RepID=UPI001F00FF87|nr:glycine-rich RNA-binding protein 10-like [Gallus gallus]